MLEVDHWQDGRAWEYRCRSWTSIQGGGRSLAQSVAAADHAVRQHLSHLLNRTVTLQEAREAVTHLPSAPETSARAPVRVVLAQPQAEPGSATDGRNDERRAARMEIPKDKVIELIKSHGHADKSGEAEQELPDQVDPQRDSGLLSKFGLEPKDVLSKLGGGKIPGL